MGPSTGSRKLAGIEHALRFIDDLAPFNVVIVLSIEGDLRDAALRPALDELQRRHPLLRASAAPAEAAERDLLGCCASESFAKALADGNLAYERRFGHVFLVCASGLSGQDMLDQLRARLDNDSDTERAVVRRDLLKITRLRLTKMLGL